MVKTPVSTMATAPVKKERDMGGPVMASTIAPKKQRAATSAFD